MKQFAKVEKKYRKFNSLLNQKFSATELTHGNYLGAAEQVYLSVLDNLLRIVSLLQGASAIDPEYIRHRHQELENLERVDEADEREFMTLKKREKLRSSQLQQVNRLLTINEESMTIMDETIAAIAALQTGSGLAEIDMETAMGHLKEWQAGSAAMNGDRKKGTGDLESGAVLYQLNSEEWVHFPRKENPMSTQSCITNREGHPDCP